MRGCDYPNQPFAARSKIWCATRPIMRAGATSRCGRMAPPCSCRSRTQAPAFPPRIASACCCPSNAARPRAIAARAGRVSASASSTTSPRSTAAPLRWMLAPTEARSRRCDCPPLERRGEPPARNTLIAAGDGAIRGIRRGIAPTRRP
ncbi:hypothetical protein WR25_16215 [Diploscapter pachys]|uniref:Uncharacterized protein n=1 Tax=Diploscapter pachys TaxID=2018661 RepID=A0A2A2JWI2_9BILA|nr:hypothetical protein WR25_16215 [Diploscapter pachys]